MSGEEWCELHFADCRIPPEDVLLPAGGFKKQMAGFNVERIGNATRSLSYGRSCFDAAREYSEDTPSNSGGRCASSRGCSGNSPT